MDPEEIKKGKVKLCSVCIKMQADLSVYSRDMPESSFLHDILHIYIIYP